MDNKTKVKVAVVIGIVILAVIFIFMVVFVKGNKNSLKKNSNIPTKNPNGPIPTSNSITQPSEDKDKDKDSDKDEDKDKNNITIDNAVSIAVENEKLVLIDADLNSSVVKELENGYSSFCYGDNKVYLTCRGNDGNYVIQEIDLSAENYPSRDIFSLSDYGSINNLEYYAGKLYFVTENGALVEYSIEEEFARMLTNENEVSHFTVDKNNNGLYVSYNPPDAECGIYWLDFTANTFSEIVALQDLAGELILNGSSLVIDVKEYGALYVYNSEQGTINAIGENSLLAKASYEVAFYQNSILFANRSKIDIKNSVGESVKDDWYVLGDDTISNISMLSDTKLQLARLNEEGRVAKSIIIDLTTGNATEAPDRVYLDAIRIK